MNLVCFMYDARGLDIFIFDVEADVIKISSLPLIVLTYPSADWQECMVVGCHVVCSRCMSSRLFDPWIRTLHCDSDGP